MVSVYCHALYFYLALICWKPDLQSLPLCGTDFALCGTDFAYKNFEQTNLCPFIYSCVRFCYGYVLLFISQRIYITFVSSLGDLSPSFTLGFTNDIRTREEPCWKCVLSKSLKSSGYAHFPKIRTSQKPIADLNRMRIWIKYEKTGRLEDYLFACKLCPTGMITVKTNMFPVSLANLLLTGLFI